MLDSLRKFFREHMAPDAQDDPERLAARARLAAATLLVEVVRSDDQFSDVERRAVVEAAGRKFGLDGTESAALVELAEAQSRQAHDLYQFTTLINASFSAEDKLRLVEELWRVAWADGELHHYEEHVIRKVADLIHVPHSAFIAAKLKVQDARGS